jgi:hypothetical protein
MRPGLQAIKDRYGFLFWLRWIFLFAGSFVASALVWTRLFKWIFTAVDGPELTLTWVIAVFGSWFLLVIPFMRKKEQIWKRLNDDQEKAVDAWLFCMGLFLAVLVVTALAWAWIFRAAIADDGMNGGWAKAVFATWLVALLPFLVLMYKQADSLFKTAEARQTPRAPRFRSLYVEREKRLLPAGLEARLKGVRPTLANGHLVTLTLKTGEKVPHVFLANGREIMGLYDRAALDFAPQDVVDLQKTPEREILPFEEEKWLRLDQAPSSD